jgi:hypothetical protein
MKATNPTLVAAVDYAAVPHAGSGGPAWYSPTGSVDFVRAYERVAAFLEERSFPLAVVGGLGLHAYGITRAPPSTST